MKKSFYIVFLIILVIYLGVSFIFFKKDDTNKTLKKEEYIYFSYNNFWKYDGVKFTISSRDDHFGEKPFYAYENGNYIGKYYLGFYEDELYLFDDQNNKLNYNGEIIAFSNQKHTVYPLSPQKLLSTDYQIIENYFKEKKLDYSLLNLDNVVKYLVDIDHDNQLEEVYSIDNMFDEEKQGKGYSLIFIHERGKIYELIKEIQTTDKSLTDGYSYQINNIVDLDNNNKIDFILSKTSYGSPQLCYLVVQKVKNEYKITREC